MSRFQEFIDYVNSIPPEERHERMEKEKAELEKSIEDSMREYVAKGGKFITQEDIDSGRAGGGQLD